MGTCKINQYSLNAVGNLLAIDYNTYTDGIGNFWVYLIFHLPQVELYG